MDNFRTESLKHRGNQENEDFLPLSQIHLYLHGRAARTKALNDHDPFCVKVSYVEIDPYT